MDKQFGLVELRNIIFDLIQHKFNESVSQEIQEKHKEKYETFMNNLVSMIDEIQTIEFVAEIIGASLLDAAVELHPENNFVRTDGSRYNAVIEGEATESEDGLCFTTLAQPIYIQDFHLPIDKITKKMGRKPKMRDVELHCTIIPNAIIMNEAHEESKKEGTS